MKTKSLYFVLFVLLAVVILIAYLVEPTKVNEVVVVSQSNVLPGFWYGLLHGIICPFVFIVSLFHDNLHIYEAVNGGHWYDFGYLLGVGIICRFTIVRTVSVSQTITVVNPRR